MNRKKRIIAKANFAVLIAVMLFACKPEGEKVTDVVLDHRELKADIGQTVTLTATVLPAEAANPKVSWEAVPKGIVELTPDGALCTVKAVKDGAAVVTVTTEDGGFTAICTVTVLPVPAESVTLDRETVSLVLGNPAAETATLTATVFPENATDKTVIWSAEPADAVKLTDYKDGRCTVKALKDGTVTVTATAVDGGFTATCTATVSQIAAESVTLDRETVSLVLGNPAADTATLTATVFPENAANKTVSWSAEPTDTVSLTDNGNGICTVKALKAGETVVTATTADGGFTATCTVTVSLIAAESVELDQKELNLIVGDPESDTATLTATVFPENAENKTVSWSADKTGYIELTDNGNGSCTVKALKAGSVTVTATVEDSGHTATCTVTVSSVSAESVELDREELNLIVGDPESDTATLTATVYPENATNKTVSWNAVPEGVVELTVDGAVCTVKALKEGEAVVMVTAADGRFTATCTVTVPPVLPESIELDQDELELVYGDSTTGTATLTAAVFPENTTDKRVRWTADPEGVVTLTDNGDGSCTVTALGVESATVTAVSVANSAVTAACRISVDYPYLTNTALIKVIDDRATDIEGNRISVGWTKESDGTVKLTPENRQKIRAVTELRIVNAYLSDLGGIEYFTGLTYLDCRSNNLETLDVTKNTALTTLDCGGNNLTTLDVTKNTALTHLSCGNNNLTTLDVTKNTALTELFCGYNRLTTLDVTNNTALTYLNCGDNNLTTLNVSGCAALTNLDCGNNNLTTLNVSGCTALTTLNCNDSNLTTLDVSGCAALTGLYVACSYGYGTLTTLDVSGCTALMTLDCHRNNLTTLDVSDCTALMTLDCHSNNLTTLDVTKNTALTELYCNSNNLTTLDVSGCAALTELYCNSNNLTTLNVSGCTALTTLWCYGNRLRTLDIRPLSRLTNFNYTQYENIWQLTLKLTREQKSKFDLQNGEYLKLEVYD